MKRVFVTGDAGFIGYHTSMRLLKSGHEVLGFDALNNYYDPQLKKARLDHLLTTPHFRHVTGALEDAQLLQDTVSDFKPDTVIHLAAQAGVRYSITNPEAYISSNIVGTSNLLNAMKITPPSHLLMASTSSVYGGNEKIPFAETDTTDAQMSLYAATKRSMEALAHSVSHLYEIPTTVFRFFTVYGPWGRPDMALFKFVKAISSNQPIDVYGFGKMRRDFTYIDDLTDCIERLMERVPANGGRIGEHDSLSPVAPYRIVNIAGGKPTPLLEFIEAVETALGSKAERHLMPMQPGDVVETYSDVSLLRQLIGYIPETPVAHGVTEFVRWYRSYYLEGSVQ